MSQPAVSRPTAPSSIRCLVHAEATVLNPLAQRRRGIQRRLGKAGVATSGVVRKAPMLPLRRPCINTIIGQPQPILTVSSRRVQILLHVLNRPSFTTSIKHHLSHNNLTFERQTTAHHLSSLTILFIHPISLLSSIVHT